MLTVHSVAITLPMTVGAPLIRTDCGKWILVPMPSSSWVLDPVKEWMVSSSSNWAFRCENLITASRTWLPLTLLSPKDQRWNAKYLFLTCPERGPEQRWACRGGRLSATSAPPLIPPSSSFPRAGLGPTGWAPQSLGKQEPMKHTSPSVRETPITGALHSILLLLG